MENMLKIVLVMGLCLGLLTLAGCGKTAQQPATGETTTIPAENGETGEIEQASTTEKPVNLVEDPLNNGEGDPLDAIGGSEELAPTIGVEVDGGNSGDTGNNGNTGNNGDTGNTSDNPGNAGGTTEESGDDFEVDFGDLIGGK